MYKVLIADDEKIIRMGLRAIVDWNALGYEIAGEAANGTEALEFMHEQSPDLVMIDIRMPKLLGLEAIKDAREKGFDGKIIVLSGYSDFAYAQTAINYGVTAYLTKPVEVDALTNALNKAKAELDEDNRQSESTDIYMQRAREGVLSEFMSGKLPAEDIAFEEFGLTQACYQVVICEKYSHEEGDLSYNFSELLKVANHDSRDYEELGVGTQNVILLKGEHAIEKLEELYNRFRSELPPEKDSPLDTIFISCGPVVDTAEDIPYSYEEALDQLNHRFFCDQHQHIIMPQDTPQDKDVSDADFSREKLINTYTDALVNHLQTFNRNQIAETLKKLQTELYNAPLDVHLEKNLLLDLYLNIKEKLLILFNAQPIPFTDNSKVAVHIHRSYYLYEIILFFSEQFEKIMNAIGYSSRDSIIDDVEHYIQHNYASNITLENIAPLFGYNSSYLGKIFNKKMGMNFNTYLDSIRIEHSKEILLSGKLQVYKIAEMVGYRNVDYFHIKFKKYTGMSPAEFRKQNNAGKDSD